MIRTEAIDYADSFRGDVWRCMDCNMAMPVIEYHDSHGRTTIRCDDCNKEITLKSKVGVVTEIQMVIRK